ncbi:tRNA uridine-5-carboxymethylaminomethyl(34) synthesis GTPase MnmE [bacterium]|nr:MAG: tRNA uridine-5-carboxymethylaminomethyl(34) synthesis GTPase MnmE [bacterium]
MTHLNQLSNDHDTIISLCTPRGSGAIAIIRLSGDNALECVNPIAKLSSGKRLIDCSSHTINHGHVVDPSAHAVIDEVMFMVMHGPKTFTGQHTVEINCHNNQFIIENIIACAIEHGARLAQPGEFTKRAFLNNKIDLLQAESINELIHAQTELSLRKALGQLQGSLSNHFNELELDVVMLLALVESAFEFVEEEQRDLAIDTTITTRTQELVGRLAEVKQHHNHQQQIKQGIRLVLIGTVNAGKSTLFNTLVKKNRAIVTDIAGTTRDSIESSRYVNGNFWLVIDTAGLRQTGDFIEQQGIERSLQEADQADMVILVVDSSRHLSEQEKQTYQEIYQKYRDKSLVVFNKIDQQLPETSAYRALFPQATILNVSGQHHVGIQELEQLIDQKIQQLFATLHSPFLLNQRQYNLIIEMEIKLKNIANSYLSGIEYELVAYQLKGILENISELTGKSITENVLDNVFSSFCVGK